MHCWLHTTSWAVWDEIGMQGYGRGRCAIQCRNGLHCPPRWGDSPPGLRCERALVVMQCMPEKSHCHDEAKRLAEKSCSQFSLRLKIARRLTGVQYPPHLWVWNSRQGAIFVCLCIKGVGGEGYDRFAPPAGIYFLISPALWLMHVHWRIDFSLVLGDSCIRRLCRQPAINSRSLRKLIYGAFVSARGTRTVIVNQISTDIIKKKVCLSFQMGLIILVGWGWKKATM